MMQDTTGPVATEMTRALTAALTPRTLVVTDDSDAHRGHGGHDPRGESHFTVDIVADAFEGQGRVGRQRMVNAALADLLRERVHALVIRARAPSEV